MGIRKNLISFLFIAAVVFPTAVFAEEVISSKNALMSVYNTRPDLQKAFDRETGLGIAGTNAGFLLDLEDWATQYGWMEHSELKTYGPKEGDGVPVRTSAEEIESSI